MSRRLAAFVAALLIGLPPAAAVGAPRPLKIDDLFEIEGLGMYYGGPYAFSPDGRALAFTRKRAKKTLRNHKWEYLWGNAAGDVWLQREPGADAVNLTNGVEDGSGWFSPQWSPDGRFLAMLSTRGDNVGLWIWETGAKALRRVTDRGVDLVNVREKPYLWLDAGHLICPVLPEGEQPLAMKIELQTPQIATREWAKTPLGKEATASVLESGVPVDLSKRRQGQLLVIDAATGTSRVLADSNTDAWQLAPGSRALAFCRQVGIYTPKADEPLRFAGSGTFSIGIRRLDGRALQTDRPLPGDVLKDSLRWSPDGGELAFFAFGENRGKAPRLFRVSAENGHVVETDLGDLDVEPAIRLQPQLEWTDGGGLLFLAARREKGERPPVTARRDWWVLSRDGKRRNLTVGMVSPPPELWPETGRSAFVGLAGGPQQTYGRPPRTAGQDDVWRIRPKDGSLQNLTDRFEPEVAEIAWPRFTNNGDDQWPETGRIYSWVVLGVQNGETKNFWSLDLHSGAIQPIRKPADDANLMAYDPPGSAVFAAGGKQGTFVWRTDALTGKSQELVAANTFLRDLAEGDARPIEYTSLNGEKLNGWILLPVGYEPGRRYPVITWVYAGYMYRKQRPWSVNIAEAHSLSMQIPAAHGFAVLMPSMPLKPEGDVEDPMLRLPEGVLPALDKAIELGIGDPDRLFVMGQSFGGFSTYGLVTQTHRFKAAAALAGLSDFISLYGQFDARERYTDSPQENLFMAALMESAQTGMGNPPWKDLGRYLRNSPIFTVDRVQTPLLILQGDLDYVAVQQGEEFFVSLYRQGKRARFVRYWGEGHVLESPANIRDLWDQIYTWFDEFGDITRDAAGTLVFEGDRVRPRKPKQ